RVGALGAVDALRPDRAVGPDVNFLDPADQAGMNDFDGAAQAGLGAALVAHLGGELLLGGELSEDAGLVDGLHQGLLAVDVLAELHRGACDDAVAVVGGGDGDGVDLVAHLVEHFAKIFEGFGVGVLLGRELEVVGIDVAQGDDLAAGLGRVFNVGGALAGAADGGDADLLVGAGDLGGDDVGEGDCGGGDAAALEHGAAGGFLGRLSGVRSHGFSSFSWL